MIKFGKQMTKEWLLDPEITYLNHGTVGATPKRVLDAQEAIRREMERQPAEFMLRELSHIPYVMEVKKPRMRDAAQAVAEFVGAERDDLVFVDNTTTGINAILRSLDLRAGDEILINDHIYGAIGNAANFVAAEKGARVKSVELPYPVSDPNSIIDAIVPAITPKTRFAIIEHITSESALILPLKEIAGECHKRGVAVIADGAHAPGALKLDLPKLGVDWYVGNLHKWAYTPRSSGFLWAVKERQKGLHPPVISWGLDKGFTAEFDWVGTKDPSPFLASIEAMAFINELGFEKITSYNHDLAWEAAKLLSQRWGTTLGMNESFVGTMSTFCLPEKLGSTKEQAFLLRRSIFTQDKIEIQLHSWKGKLWVRVSAQIYNDMSDIDRLGKAIEKRL
jgi:isopenicillin-N epimerase